MNHRAFTTQPQRIVALWPVLISRPTEGRRLSWPGWLVTYEVVCPPEDGHSSQYQLTDSAAAGDRTHDPFILGQKVKGRGHESQKHRYDTIRYIYVRSKSDEMASFI